MVDIAVSCKKFVTIDPPVSQTVSANVFNNASSATSALLNIYQQMYQNSASYNISVSNGLLSDELTYSGSNNVQNIQYYTNSMSALSGDLGPWSTAYQYIYQANAIIENLSNNSLSPLIVKQLTGEAKFVRAFWTFYLTNFYGDIPLVLSTDYNINAVMPRMPQNQVYRQIITDLENAKSLLNDHFVDGTDTSVTSERVRPTQWAAEALLARTYLYMQKYDSAEMYATQVINNALFRLPALDSVFLANSPEAIWQLATPLTSGSNNGTNTQDGHFFILTGAGDIQVSSRLVNAFESGDTRLNKWIGSITANNPSVTYYFPFKYKIRNDPNPSNTEEYTMVLRLGEQYLIRAEARAQQANIDGAKSDLDMIRMRAGLGSTTAGDKTALLSAILHERQAELFTEWGHRWLDIVRTGSADSIMGTPGNVCQTKGGTWNSNWQLYPIPQGERNNDPSLTQNNGY